MDRRTVDSRRFGEERARDGDQTDSMPLMIVECKVVEEVTMRAVWESLYDCVEVFPCYCTTLLCAVCLTKFVAYKAIVDNVRI
jgi:hypothetical protein